MAVIAKTMSRPIVIVIHSDFDLSVRRSSQHGTFRHHSCDQGPTRAAGCGCGRWAERHRCCSGVGRLGSTGGSAARLGCSARLGVRSATWLVGGHMAKKGAPVLRLQLQTTQVPVLSSEGDHCQQLRDEDQQRCALLYYTVRAPRGWDRILLIFSKDFGSSTMRFFLFE